VDRREEAVALLRRWVMQQHRDGVERVVFDPEPETDFDSSLVSDEPVTEPEPERHAAGEDSLEAIRSEVLVCARCALSESRTQAVPGVGHPRAKLVFVGEAPGAEEDRRGEPFVGRAGQLLDKILEAIELRREDVHILNILKCRPPENRNPAPDEIVACRPFLERQLAVIEPKIIVALGLFAAQWLTGKKLSLTRLRESGPHEYAGIKVFATYHPAALLRNPGWKRPAWADYQAIRKEYDRL